MLAVWAMEPEVAVTVTVLVPAGVAGVVPELPHAVSEPRPIAHSTSKDAAKSADRKPRSRPLRRSRRRRSSVPAPPSSRQARISCDERFGRAGSVSAPVLTLVAMFRVVDTALPVGVMLAGEKLQVDAAGRPEQTKLTAWLNPPVGVTVSVALPVWPRAIVRVAGLAATVKDGGAAETVTVTAAEDDTPKLLSPA